MSGLIGKKIGMTSIFDDKGKNIPCTVIQAGPCVVTQIKSNEVDGYSAVQLGFNDKSDKHSNKSEAGHFSKSKTSAKYKLVEFQNFDSDLNLGDSVSVDHFTEGEFVDVSGNSKGKGFQGIVKRHNFAGVGQATHGQHNRLRAPGSIGAASFPARVFKGMKMAGRTGGERVKAINSQIIQIIPEKNLVLVKGAIPGHNGSTIIIEA